MRRIAICLAIFTTLSLGVVAPSGAASTTPNATATAVGADDVRVNWTFTSSSAAKYRTVQIERADAGGAFSLLLSRKGGGRKSSYTDKTAGARGASYRLRVVDTSTGTAVNSAWSNVVSVPPATTTTTPTTAPTNPDMPALKPGQVLCGAGEEAEALSEVNRMRPGADLTENAQLMWAARDRSVRLADAGALDDHSGKQAALNRAGVQFAAAENLAMSMGDGVTVVGGWMTSTGHRNTILGGSGRVGISCVLGAPGAFGRQAYWTLLVEWPSGGWTSTG